jgi:hypothetical protein
MSKSMKIFKHLNTDWFRYGFETIAVVVGILVAFALDNWNEDRKLQNEELELLVDIQNNLEATIEHFIADTVSHYNDIVLYSKIEYYINNNLPYSQELDSCFGRLNYWHSPYTTSAAYKTLQSKGLDLIKNETLKNDIINLHEFTYIILTEDYDQSEWNLSQTVVTPFYVKHIRSFQSPTTHLARPNDFESLKRNDEFQNILSLLIRQRKKGLLVYKKTLTSMHTLVKDIENEINSRGKQ